MKTRYSILLVGVLAIAACGARTSSNVEPDTVNRALLSISPQAQQFYSSPDAPSWDNEDIADLRRAIEKSAEHGLNPEDYHQIALRTDGLKQEDWARLAIDAYFRLASHLRNGKVDQQDFTPKWEAAEQAEEFFAKLTKALNTSGIEESINDLAPKNDEYVRLQRALAEFKKKPPTNGWTPIPSSPALTPGDHSKWVVTVKQRLLKKKSDSSFNDLYDEDLESAVKQFQRNASLTPDGILGPETIERLNTSQKNKQDIIRVNMERWRWLPRDLGKRHIRVNIADYTLQAYEGGKVIGRHDVVVGKVYRQTPIFSDEITYLVVNPWWIVPHTLAVKDLLPKFQKDPEVIERKHYQIYDESGEVVDPDDINWNEFTQADFPFEIRQKPGEENALGRIKFIFPNKHDVYLHDSPAQHLFTKIQRDFSSGCIRVQAPFLLAGWILKDRPEWTKQQLSSVLATNKTETISLNTPLPVHLMYWTAVVKDDQLQFPADVYDRDDKVLAALNASQPDD